MASKARNTTKLNIPKASKSRIIGNSQQISNSSRRIGVSSSGNSLSTSARVYWEGVDVTPQSLLISSSSSSSSSRTSKKKEGGPNQSTRKVEAVSSSFSSSSRSINSNHSSNSIPKSPRNNNPSSTPSQQKNPSTENKLLDSGISIRKKRSKLHQEPTFNLLPKKINETTGPITIRLQETPTIFLFSLYSVCVAQDSYDHPVVSQRNQYYKQLCDSKSGSDSFVTHNSQTLNYAQKNKEMMAAPPASRDAGCQATSWDLYDSQMDSNSMTLDLDDGTALVSSKSESHSREGKTETALVRQVQELVEASLSSPGCLLEVEGNIVPSLYRRAHMNRKHPDKYDIQSNDGQSRVFTNDSQSFNSSRMINVSKKQFQSMDKKTKVTEGYSDENAGQHSNSDAGQSSQDILNTSNSQINGRDNQTNETPVTTVDVQAVIARRQAEGILKSSSLLRQLKTIDRVVQQNLYHERHLLYRNFPLTSHSEPEKVETSTREIKEQLRQSMEPNPSEEDETTEETTIDTGNEGAASTNNLNPTTAPSHSNEPSTLIHNDYELTPLWGFHCHLTKGRTITCMVWNKVNSDLLAVAYGQFDFRQNQKDGLVLFWSLKNPKFPERIYQMTDGVTSIDFSTVHPYLLAVGFYNGVVAIYDTRKQEIPILESGQGSGTHMDAVWQVKWVDKGSERGETLVSISSDGRVTEWSMKKGLTHTDLMHLKRIANQHTGSTTYSEGIISRQASGHCIDFAQNDRSVYFAGTEDGIIHKCSCSYNEQYLESYFGHSGPVYGLRISPFWPQAFLSCSSDWTVKLWNQQDSQEVLSFHSVDLSHAVQDVAWSPSNSTVFGSVTEDGRIEIWDLSKSTLDPVVTHFPMDSPFALQIEQEALENQNLMMNAEDEDMKQLSSLDSNDKSSSDLFAYQRESEETQQNKSKQIQCTSLLFAPSAPVLVVGDSLGVVTVYRLPTFGDEKPNGIVENEKEKERLIKVMYPDGV